MFEAFRNFWKSLSADGRYCHVYRPQRGIVQIHSGVIYGRGELLATGTEIQPGEAVPTLFAECAQKIGYRRLIGTPDDASISALRPGALVPGAFEPWYPALPVPGEIWTVKKEAVYAGFPRELCPLPTFDAFDVRILERVRDSMGRQFLRIIAVENGKSGCVSIRLFGPDIHPRQH